MLRSGVIGFIALVAACSSGGKTTSTTADAGRNAPGLGPLGDAATTDDRTLVPKMARQDAASTPNPALSTNIVDLLQRGFGDLGIGPGEPYSTATIDGSPPPAPGPNAHRILRFAHLADLQIADDESPTRVATLDSSFIPAAIRPHDMYLCALTNAAVRTINALHRRDPLAFTLLGGDNADSAQTNELDWVLGMLSGSPYVKCDSGDVSDPVPGPANDGKDAFAAEGLAMPWKWMTGNHDVLVQGNFPVGGSQTIAIGKHAQGGTRNYATDPNGAIQTGDFVVPDVGRTLLDRPGLMAKVAADKDGHGIGEKERASGRATYAFDADGTPIRFVILDTAHEDGGSEGVITQSQIDTQIRALLDQAKADGKWVILASHHAADALTNGGSVGSVKKEPDALTTAAWVDFVSSHYDNVLFSLVGHSHRHRVAKLGTQHFYWEVMTAAIADWPNEFRLIEIFDQDNGWIMMRATCMDFATDGDPIAAEGKRRATTDETTGWLPAPVVDATDRNVELWIKKP